MLEKTTLTLLLLTCSITQAIQIIDGDVEVIAGEDVELVCKVIGAGDVLQVDWMKTTLKTRRKNIFTIIRDRDPTTEQSLVNRLSFTGNVKEGIGNIVLKATRIQDNGNYTCSFILFEGGPVSKSVQLNVRALPEANVLTITPLVGKSEATLATCSADNAFPAAKVSWNTSSLGNTVTITTTSTENPDGTINVTCNIMGVPSRDIHQKKVLCLVRHPTLKGEELKINYSVNIHYPPQSPTVILLESPPPSLWFKCQVDANPEAENYIWRRNGHLLSNGVKADGNMIHFQKLTSEMNGLYDCEVSNVYGSATSSLHVYATTNERHYFFFWIPFTMFLNTIAVCLLLNRKDLKHVSGEIIVRYFSKNEDTEDDQPSRTVESGQSRSSKHSPEQSGHEERNLREDACMERI